MKTKKKDGAIFYPELDVHFVVQSETKVILDEINNLSKKKPRNLLLVGPAGCGKTELGVWLAAKYDRPCMVVNCPAVRETRDWFGSKAAKDGTTYFEASEFVRAVRMGNCIVILDEFNRLHAQQHNALFQLTDPNKFRVYVEELKEEIEAGPGTIFFATANIGSSFTGTFTLDHAMEERFGIRIAVSFLKEPQEIKLLRARTGVSEATAVKLVQLGNKARAKASGGEASLSQPISTRTLLLAAELCRALEERGADVKLALRCTIIEHYPDDGGTQSERAQILQLVQGIFGGDKPEKEKAE